MRKVIYPVVQHDPLACKGFVLCSVRSIPVGPSRFMGKVVYTERPRKDRQRAKDRLRRKRIAKAAIKRFKRTDDFHYLSTKYEALFHSLKYERAYACMGRTNNP